MNWILLDQDSCNKCGICTIRCPDCFVKQNGEITAHASEESCSLCGHCVALCPTGAIAHERMDMSNFIENDGGSPLETEAFIRFLRARRSHRHFHDREIPQETLERLIDVCRYAPTGGNVQSVEIIVVRDAERIRTLSDMTTDFFIDMGKGAEASLKELASGESGAIADLQSLQTLAYYKTRFGLARERGEDAIFYRAPAVIIFHSHQQTRTPKDNCVIASTMMALTARTMGLESTFIGLFEVASRMSQSIVEELGLPVGHEIFSVLIMGYPKLTFHRTVDRHPIKSRWL
jgi:nitroreductase/NAD-dependent dihydropyrimidine dehydrogenase PreA subunit